MSPTTPAPYADAPARLQALQAQQTAAYLRQARTPGAQGGAALKLFAAVYEGRAALAEQNSAWASAFLPGTAQPQPATGTGLPLVPVGVRYVLDEAAPGKLTLSVDVAGPVTLRVVGPTSPVAFTPLVSYAPTRATSVFDAPVDGCYVVTLSVGTTYLATLYIFVMRAEWRLLRAHSRELAFGSRDTLPRPGAAYCGMLARLIAAEAAARTGQPELAARLLDSARALPRAASPVGLTPFRRA